MLTEFIKSSANSKNNLGKIEVRNKVIKELKFLKYNFSYKGTKYLVDAICIIYALKNYYDCNLEKDIYPIVAKKYKESVNNVKCNITNSTDKMCYDCDEAVLIRYLGDYKYVKPGPKKIVLAVLRRI